MVDRRPLSEDSCKHIRRASRQEAIAKFRLRSPIIIYFLTIFLTVLSVIAFYWRWRENSTVTLTNRFQQCNYLNTLHFF